jgi:bifunctional DNase/RNase|tara:strand:+ start:3700 stop:4311 length:612 start_codon:yes stop_codon:yes gene_type:complete
MADKIKLKIIGLSYSQTQSGAYALILGEEKGKRRLPIIIGNFEAQAIAIELENMKSSRPLTHDVFKTFAKSFKIKVAEVIIYNLVEGIFYAKLICQQEGSEDLVEIDARTSDSIALAVRFKCPVFTYEFILSNAGIVLGDEPNLGIDDNIDIPDTDLEIDEITEYDEFSMMNEEDLNNRLNEAIENEDYEKATRIRDELNQRK